LCESEKKLEDERVRREEDSVKKEEHKSVVEKLTKVFQEKECEVMILRQECEKERKRREESELLLKKDQPSGVPTGDGSVDLFADLESQAEGNHVSHMELSSDVRSHQIELIIPPPMENPKESLVYKQLQGKHKTLKQQHKAIMKELEELKELELVRVVKQTQRKKDKEQKKQLEAAKRKKRKGTTAPPNNQKKKLP